MDFNGVQPTGFNNIGILKQSSNPFQSLAIINLLIINLISQKMKEENKEEATAKKVTITELKRYLPLQPPSSGPKLPDKIIQYMASPKFSNMSIIEQRAIKNKYETVYRNYYAIQDITKHIDDATKHKYSLGSIRKTLYSCAQKYGVADWYKLIRIIMSNSIEAKHFVQIDKIKTIDLTKQLFKKYAKKVKIHKGVLQVQQTRSGLDPKVLNKLIEEAVKETQQYIDRNRHKCQRALQQGQGKYPRLLNYILLERIVNQQLEMLMDRKKTIYLYLHFDRQNKGFFPLNQLMSQWLTIKKVKAVKKQTYYLTQFQQIIERIRNDMKVLFYSAHEMQNDFDQFYAAECEKNDIQVDYTEQLNKNIFYEYVSSKCDNQYSMYHINKVYKQIMFRPNIQFLYNKPKPFQMSKILTNFLTKTKRRRILKKQNQVFYSYRTIILHLISRCKSSKLSLQKLSQFLKDIDPTPKFKSFYSVWRVYPSVINVERIKRQCNVNPLACYFKLRRTDDEYDKMYDNLLQQMPQDAVVTYEKVEEKLNVALDFVLDTTKIKPLALDRYDEISYQEAIKKIFQPDDFQLKIRKYIHTKVSQKAYALWKGYKISKQVKQRAHSFIKSMAQQILPQHKATIDSNKDSKKMSRQKSKSSIKSKKQIPSYNPQTLEIVKWNIQKLLNQLSLDISSVRRQFHRDQHIREHLCVNKRQQYEYRTLTPRFIMHPIPGIIGFGSDLMFLKKSKSEKIKIKFFYKPGIQIIDFSVIGNDIIVLTSYFTLQFYSLSQQSNYSFQTIQLLDHVEQINSSTLDSLCQDRVYSRYPIFIRCSGKKIIVNTSLVNNQIAIVNIQSSSVEGKISFTQKQHILNNNIVKIVALVNKSPRKSQLYQQLFKQLSQQTVKYQNVKKIISAEEDQQQNQLNQTLKRVAQSEIKDFIRKLSQYHAALVNCILKQQLNFIKQRKTPQSLTDVLHALMSYMLENNLSLANILQLIDKENEGFIRLKHLKDFLLKITQQVYLANQKQIDNYLKNITAGKHVQYDSFCEIMAGWKYKIWERPKLIVKDFIYVADANIIIYTIEDNQNIYIKNIHDNLIIAVLSGHNAAPSIYFIQQSFILITGDEDALRFWRIYQDLINKYDENPPWEIQPYATFPQAHQGMITSILYLNRANHLVTTSLDSTTKFWKINFVQANQHERASIALEEIKRLYSNESIYLNAKSNLILLDSEGCRIQLLAISKISKHVNDNNKYKYEMKLEVFEVQNTKIKTGSNFIHLDLPPKLKQALQTHVDILGIKKSLLLTKTIGHYQHQATKNILIAESIQRTLYEAVKNLFIFQSFTPIEKTCQYISNKNVSIQMMRILFQKYGIGIPKPNNLAPIKSENENIIKPEFANTFFNQQIEISGDEIQCLMDKLKQVAKRQNLNLSNVLSISGNFLNLINYEKLQQILRNKYTDDIKIDLNKLTQLFKPLKLDSQLERLYAILRSVSILMKQKGLKIWNIFTMNKNQLQKKRSIDEKQFEEQMLNLKLPKQKISLIISYLSKKRSINLEDLIYYTKLAWESVGQDFNQSNFSKIFMKNSRLLQSRLEMFKIDNGIQIQRQSFEDKAKLFKEEPSQSNLRQSLVSKRRQGSKKQLKSLSKQSQRVISESDSLERSSILRDSKQLKGKSFGKSEFIAKDQAGLNSNQLSSSNSRVSLSHESNVKDQYKKQITNIVKKIKQILKNQGKTIWDITSLSVAEFMENNFITQTEYFNILSAIKSPIYLNDKLKLMGYIMRESENYSLDLNILFQLFEPVSTVRKKTTKQAQVNKLDGEKYIISYLVSKLTQNGAIIEHSLSQHIFNGKDEVTIEQILTSFAQNPINMLNFCLRQFQMLISGQNKLTFTLQQLKLFIEVRIHKFNIKVESKQISLIEDIIHKTQSRSLKLQELLPKEKTNNGHINFNIFKSMISSFFNEKDIILRNQFANIISHIAQEKHNNDSKQKINQSPNRFNKIKGSPIKKANVAKKQINDSQLINKAEIKYKDLINYLSKKMLQVKKQTNFEKDGAKKFLKALENKKITLLMFFVSLDRNRNFFINDIQFSSGLAQLKINENFWPSIKKRNQKKLFYFEIITYLVQNQLVGYKCVDSQLEAAMIKYLKKFVRNDDIESVFDRIRAKDSDEPFNATFESFSSALKMSNLFKQQQIQYLFSAFVNAQYLKSSNLSNDNLIKEPANMKKKFNFKMFADVISNYKNQNITKTPQYRICTFLKKRGISLLNQFTKWMERNKKIKQVSEAIKQKQFTLPRELYVGFVKQLGSQLQEKQIKQMMSSFPNPLQFSVFNQKLQQIYKKGNSNIQVQQITAYLQQIYAKIKKINVSIERLFQDFSNDKYKMSITNFTQMINFLQIGLTKIQNKQIFATIDLQKKSYITLNQLENALEDASETMEKQDDEYQFDYIIQKLINNKDKYLLKTSRINFTLERAYIIFSSLLTHQQITMLYKRAQQQLKLSQLTEKNLENYIVNKQRQSKAKKDKKYKQLLINFLNFLKKANLQANQVYHYFSKDTESLNKNKFLICYQSLGLKANIMQINTLYSYLDQGMKGNISLQKWEDKLSFIQYQKDNDQKVSGEQLQIFYKVKLILSDIYLLFVRKLFKTKQIFAYFNVNGTGFISYGQFMDSLQKLGMNLDENMKGKLLNYMDKQRTNQIEVVNIVYQLQNCLTSRAKLILQTKTSCIFKQKIHLIQQKQGYFLQKLVGYEHFLQHNDKLQSCILITDFVDLIKNFGIVLGEDQFNDVQRNFKYNKDNLCLYPLYYMFINIFKSFQNTVSSDSVQRSRYQKLFNQIIRNKLTMKIFEKIKTTKQVMSFLTQLKIFTPIQVKLMTESITLGTSQLVDTDLLIRKTRDSFLVMDQGFRNATLVNFQTDRKVVLKQWLKQQLSENKVTSILKSNSGKIDMCTFQNLLTKIGFVFKKSDLSELFAIFSKGEDFVLIQELISKQDQIKQELQNDIDQYRFNDELLDHICKSLNFKGVSLEQSWEKYYTNFGFISQLSFYSFLDQIGFDYKQKQYEKIVPQFLQHYTNQTKLEELKTTELQNIMKKQLHIPQKLCVSKIYQIQMDSIQFLREVINNGDQFMDEISHFISNQNISTNKIGVNYIYQFIKSFIKNKSKGKRHSNQKQIAFFTNLFIQCQEISLKQFELNVKNYLNHLALKKNNAIRMQTENQSNGMINDLSRSSLGRVSKSRPNLNKINFEQNIKKICHQNFVYNYKTIINSFSNKINTMNIPIENNYRICLTLVVESLLDNDYLLFLKPKLASIESDQAEQKNTKHAYIEHSIKFNMKTVANLIVEKEIYVQKQGVWLINDKYYGMSINEKKDFQVFASIQNLLNPNEVFLRAKNYYLWQPNQQKMPKQLINYKWKYILIVLQKICKQIQTLEEHGYGIPHLRWRHLEAKKGISKVLFPAHADGSGRLQSIPHQNLLKIDDPYCAPEIFRQKSGKIGLKINTWILGCLIYELIWGHSPNSFFNLLYEHIQNRQSVYELSEVLQMEELPHDFEYSPFRFNKIKQVLAFEHQLKSQGIGDDLQNNIIYFGLRGIVKNLQILYAEQFMYYRSQFEIFQNLHFLIIQCLDPNPATRPNINKVLQKITKYIDEQDFKDFNYNDYITILSNHQSIIQLNEKFVDKLKRQFINAKTTQIKQLINNFQAQLIKCQKYESINEIYVIPKKYPWPDKNNQDAYDRQLLLNQQFIRSHGSYNIICSLMNQNCLQMLINLYVQYFNANGQNAQSETIFSNLLKSISIIFQSLRRYSSPFCGYVGNILQSFVQLYYRLPFYFSNSNVEGAKLKISKSSLSVINKNSHLEQKALRIIKNIIYLDGHANVEYLPIHHFMLARPQYRSLFQYFYSSIDLQQKSNKFKTQAMAQSMVQPMAQSMLQTINHSLSQSMVQSMLQSQIVNINEQDRRSLAISYFRDHMYDDYYWHIVSYLKVDVLMIKLIDDQAIVLQILMFFKDFTSSEQCINFPLIHSNILYLKLGIILIDKLVSVQVKIAIIEIFINLLRFKNMRVAKYMMQPSFSLIRETLKLLIEPVRGSAMHQQYTKMVNILSIFVETIKQFQSFFGLVRQIQGSQTIFQVFQKVIQAAQNSQNSYQ